MHDWRSFTRERADRSTALPRHCVDHCGTTSLRRALSNDAYTAGVRRLMNARISGTSKFASAS